MTARKRLDVWLYGTQVATIADHGREIRLEWSQEAYERWGQAEELFHTCYQSIDLQSDRII
jgi:hypothetical protein